MTMCCTNSANLSNLIEVAVNDQLFSRNLDTKVFKSFLEILKNASNHKLKKCFKKKTRKLLKKYKLVINQLLNKKKKIKKRKKMFLKSSKSFRKVVDKVMTDFLQNCVTDE